MYLYLGYLFVQTYFLIDKLVNTSMSGVAFIFSIVVFFIWSSIPFIGYLIAKYVSKKGYLAKPVLFSCGVIGALIEHGLYYFDILYYNQLYMGTFIVFCFFFIVGLIRFKPTKAVGNG